MNVNVNHLNLRTLTLRCLVVIATAGNLKVVRCTEKEKKQSKDPGNLLHTKVMQWDPVTFYNNDPNFNKLHFPLPQSLTFN